MTQKQSSEKLVPELLQSIEPRGIADRLLRQTIEVLLNLIEELNLKVKSLEEENQPPGDFRRLPYGVLGLLPRTTCL